MDTPTKCAQCGAELQENRLFNGLCGRRCHDAWQNSIKTKVRQLALKLSVDVPPVTGSGATAKVLASAVPRCVFQR